MAQLITTLGPIAAGELGMILPHEHVFVDIRLPDHPGHGNADVADVVALMAPEIERARAAGVTAIVECTPVGVGRRADCLLAVSLATGIPLVAPTGIYREPWVPAWAHRASEHELHEWMRGELDGEIEGSGVRAGFIKLSAGDDGITPTEAKILRAAARAGRETGAAIASHTVRGRVTLEQIDIIVQAGYRADRFVWVHADNEPDMGLHREAARRGAWIEYDHVNGPETDEENVARVTAMLDAGHGDQLLLSHDQGWYDPAQPGGGTPRPFTHISVGFLPRLRDAGVDAETIERITARNPFRAFAR